MCNHRRVQIEQRHTMSIRFFLATSWYFNYLPWKCKDWSEWSMNGNVYLCESSGETKDWRWEESSPCWSRTWWRPIIWVSTEESAVCCRSQSSNQQLAPKVYESSIQKPVHHFQSRGPKRLHKNSIPGFPHPPRHQSRPDRRAWPHTAMGLVKRN